MTDNTPARRESSVATLAKQKRAKLKAMLSMESVQAGLIEVAREEIDPQRMMRMVMVAAIKNPEILECTAESVLRVLMECAELGLEPSSIRQEAHIIPYKSSSRAGITEATLQIGYKGVEKLVRRSGFVDVINAVCVHDGDLFEVELGLNPTLKHLMGTGPRQDSTITHVYAYAKLSNGAKKFEVLDRGEINKIRGCAYERSKPWEQWYGEMAKKSAIKRLAKHLPMDDQGSAAIALSERREIGDNTPLVDSDVLADRISAQMPASAEQEPPPPEPVDCEVEAPPAEEWRRDGEEPFDISDDDIPMDEE